MYGNKSQMSWKPNSRTFITLAPCVREHNYPSMYIYSCQMLFYEIYIKRVRSHTTKNYHPAAMAFDDSSSVSQAVSKSSVVVWYLRSEREGKAFRKSISNT